jgi:transposase
MKILLTTEQKQQLELEHRYESDARICDRIKAVLLKSENWTNKAIAQALRIHEETVSKHLKEWVEEKKIAPDNGGSRSKLNAKQTAFLEKHLADHCYTQAIQICGYVEKTFAVCYTVSGMTKWLKQHDFRYKKPKGIPAKIDNEKQEAFIESYLKLLDETSVRDPIVFIDATHPTMATKVSFGWIKKGVDKPIKQTASRTRLNIMGAIELSTMKVLTTYPDLVNKETTVNFLSYLKASYPMASKIHVILDQSSYHTSGLVKNFAKAESIDLHYLPPYSPNLNPIERLWKVMNEKVRNNRFFESAKDFRDCIKSFFAKTFLTISDSLRHRINDNFQFINPAPSS